VHEVGTAVASVQGVGVGVGAGVGVGVGLGVGDGVGAGVGDGVGVDVRFSALAMAAIWSAVRNFSEPIFPPSFSWMADVILAADARLTLLCRRGPWHWLQ
jgi:hypothetical protein